MTRPKFETIRRVRLGDLKRVLRSRYGYELPDDDAGRADLVELLMLSADKNFANVIEIWAPWLHGAEADSIIAHVASLPNAVRLSSPEALGQRLRLTDAERTKLGVSQIAPAT